MRERVSAPSPAVLGMGAEGHQSLSSPSPKPNANKARIETVADSQSYRRAFASSRPETVQIKNQGKQNVHKYGLEHEATASLLLQQLQSATRLHYHIHPNI